MHAQFQYFLIPRAMAAVQNEVRCLYLVFLHILYLPFKFLLVLEHKIGILLNDDAANSCGYDADVPPAHLLLGKYPDQKQNKLL